MTNNSSLPFILYLDRTCRNLMTTAYGSMAPMAFASSHVYLQIQKQKKNDEHHRLQLRLECLLIFILFLFICLLYIKIKKCNKREFTCKKNYFYFQFLFFNYIVVILFSLYFPFSNICTENRKNKKTCFQCFLYKSLKKK